MNVLIVAPSFPPDESVGTLRMASLVRYLLKQRDIHIWVLTDTKKKEPVLEGIAYSYVAAIYEGGYRAWFRENTKRYKQAFCGMISQEKPDLVLISGGPFFTFRLSPIAKKHGIPCILDFRDPWVFDKRERKGRAWLKATISKLIKLPMERRAIWHADRVVTVTRGWMETFQRYYPLCRKKFSVIMNGYDDDRLKSLHIPQQKKEQGMRLGVFGKIFYYSQRYSDVFLDALKAETVPVVQIGDREPQVNDWLGKHGLPESAIESTGFIQYEKGMEQLAQMDAFLIIDSRKDALGTKVYDYIYLNKPILFVGPKDSVLAALVGSLKNGYVCASAEEVTAAIRCIRTNPGQPDTEADVLAYARSVQNQKWLELIRDTAKRSNRQEEY